MFSECSRATASSCEFQRKGSSPASRRILFSVSNASFSTDPTFIDDGRLYGRKLFSLLRNRLAWLAVFRQLCVDSTAPSRNFIILLQQNAGETGFEVCASITGVWPGRTLLCILSEGTSSQHGRQTQQGKDFSEHSTSLRQPDASWHSRFTALRIFLRALAISDKDGWIDRSAWLHNIRNANTIPQKCYSL